MSLRESKMKGQFIQSTEQWLQTGEKEIPYFCNLESKNYSDKTITKVCTENGETITSQDDILKIIKDYYGNLFKTRDSMIEDIDLDEILEPNLSKQKPISLKGQ